MNARTSTRLKYFVVLVAMALILESVLKAGSTAGPATIPGAQSGATSRPVVSIKRLPKPLPYGNAILRIQFPNNERAGKQFRLKMNSGVTLVFADDGTRGDEKAGDGVLS